MARPLASPGRTIASYQWSISGTTSAHFTSATNASVATLVADQTGSDLSLTLTVTDSTGQVGSTSQTIAVAAAPTVNFTVTNQSPVAGSSVTLDGRGSSAAPGHAISTYQWSIVSGQAFAALSGASNASTAALSTSAAGAVVVRLTITDDAGASKSMDRTISVAVPPVVVTAPTSGGGAMGVGWLLSLALAVVALAHRPGRPTDGDVD